MASSSLLFVPADRPERIAKALAAGAGAVIVDLEDAVGLQAKDAAREQLAQWLAAAGEARVVVRVNGVGTPWFAADIALCASPAVAAVMLPKAATSSPFRTSKFQVSEDAPIRTISMHTSTRSPVSSGFLKSQLTFTRGQPPAARSKTSRPSDRR